jgi:nitrate reductase (NAD(P)H)
MDESLALQPRNMYWNATGMMNNWWFRVCIHQMDDGKLRFEHPTMAGTQPGGWMQRLKDEGLDPTKPIFSTDSTTRSTSKAAISKPAETVMTKPGVDRKITVAELESSEAKEQAWFVVRGEVYNGSGFFTDHPGGADSIILVAGEDATEDFMAIHSSDARKQLADFHIGTLIGTQSSKVVEVEENPGSFLHPKKWKQVKLLKIEDVSGDAKIFRFSLPHAEQELGLPFGQHVYARLRRKVAHQESAEIVQGELVQRAYTPLSERNAKGFIDLLIKIYYPSAEFPQGGRMTLCFSELVVGDMVELKGPVGHFVWKGNGIASLHGEEKRIAEIGLVCAGSGITPILQVLRAILTDPAGYNTKVWVLDLNRFPEDILCREELDRLALQHKSHFKLHYSLTGKPVPEDWPYSTGRITDAMLVSHLPPPGQDRLVCICGPPLMEQSVKAALNQMGWDLSNQVLLF